MSHRTDDPPIDHSAVEGDPHAPPSTPADAPVAVPATTPERADGDSPAGASTPAPLPPRAPQLVDPAVSRAKFERELENYRAMQGEYVRRGWVLVRAEYPEVLVLFAASKLNPTPVLFGALLDFTNFDFWPPSVRFVNPFTGAPLRFDEMSTHLWRRVETTPGVVQVQPLLQHQADGVPFLCVRGVREYHEHPAHSNDPWLAHRGTGVGTLYDLLNVIYRYGVVPLTKFAILVTSIECKIAYQAPDPAEMPV